MDGKPEENPKEVDMAPDVAHTEPRTLQLTMVPEDANAQPHGNGSSAHEEPPSSSLGHTRGEEDGGMLADGAEPAPKRARRTEAVGGSSDDDAVPIKKVS